MKPLIIFLTILLLVFLVLPGQTQITVQGTVVDETGSPAISGNVIIKGTYDGVSTDFNGYYSILTNDGDTLVFSYLGYTEEIRAISLAEGNLQTINIRLKPIVNLLTQAIVEAKKKNEVKRLSSSTLDQHQVFTTAGDPGNILAAAQGGSSAAVNPETGRLLARGGRARETQFYMDGLLLSSPYINTAGGVVSRLKQNPYMVAGVDLYNGTASAEYGQAISSVVMLNTKERIRQNQTNLSLSTVGLNANIERKVGKGGIVFNSDLLDLRVNNALTVTNLTWEQPYRSMSNQLLWELPIGKDRQVKIYANRATNTMGVKSFYDGEVRNIDLGGQQNNVSFSYKHLLSDKWDISLGTVYQKEINDTDIQNSLTEQTQYANVHAKGVVKYYGPKELLIKLGMEYLHDDFQQDVHFQANDFTVANRLKADNLAGFAEGEKEVLKHLTIRVGGRLDYINTADPQLALRTLLGYEFNKHLSLAASYGTFYQDAPSVLRYYQPGLQAERSEQMIMTLDYHRQKREYSVSVYRKNYAGLVRYSDDYQYRPATITSNGKGFVDGVDVAIVDRKTFQDGEIRMAYSYTNSLRNDGTYNTFITPSFLYRHQMTFSAKRFVPTLNSNISFTAIVADGKSFDNPFTLDIQEQDALKIYKSLSLNYTYLTRLIGNKVSYLHFSVDNLLNINNEVGLSYTAANQLVPLMSNNRRSFFLALIVNF